jgi:hypothetical protein
LARTVPKPAEWQRIGNQIDAAMIFAREDLVNVLEFSHRLIALWHFLIALWSTKRQNAWHVKYWEIIIQNLRNA